MLLLSSFVQIFGFVQYFEGFNKFICVAEPGSPGSRFALPYHGDFDERLSDASKLFFGEKSISSEVHSNGSDSDDLTNLSNLFSKDPASTTTASW